ncbi:MAG TPA: hypothetical protein PLF35_06090 [Prolixibacteraceae bacterium]|nr:hypothetical protein [Prolixibacteraceae bacterium]
MEATIRIKPQELTLELIEKVRSLFKNEEALEITIAPLRRFEMIANEPKEEYLARVNKAIENLEAGKDSIAFSENEFDALANDLLKSK